jgi:predicted AAA+ superfamily ATPase
MKRLYQKVIEKHFRENRQMIFLMGPRQVGKTTTGKSVGEQNDPFLYFNWDNQDHRKILLEGPEAVASYAKLEVITKTPTILVFDEIHKFDAWKEFLKGFYDTYGQEVRILVTGSARLDISQKGGDSLMGRYFPYHIHPLSIGEIIRQEVRDTEIEHPKKISQLRFQSLWKFGGFPEPFLKENIRFFNRWKLLRLKQLVREDIRDLTQIQELDKIEVLIELIRQQVGQLTTFYSLSKKIRASDNSIRKWLSVLTNLYYCFPLRPWSKNIAHSLLKEPKYYLWDWALCENDGAKAENFIAAHLLKAVHFWTDYELGDYGLYFLRDRYKKEVDFLITKNRKPWILIEVKTNHHQSLSPSLKYYYDQLQVEHAFQVAFDLPYIDKDCFSAKNPKIVPALTFLSQLI